MQSSTELVRVGGEAVLVPRRVTDRGQLPIGPSELDVTPGRMRDTVRIRPPRIGERPADVVLLHAGDVCGRRGGLIFVAFGEMHERPICSPLAARNWTWLVFVKDAVGCLFDELDDPTIRAPSVDDGTGIDSARPASRAWIARIDGRRSEGQLVVEVADPVLSEKTSTLPVMVVSPLQVQPALPGRAEIKLGLNLISSRYQDRVSLALFYCAGVPVANVNTGIRDKSAPTASTPGKTGLPSTPARIRRKRDEAWPSYAYCFEGCRL